MSFVAARWFTPTKGRVIDLIVLHSMEAPEKGTTAEAVANYFRNCGPNNKVSAHYCVDSDSVVQTVHTRDVAYAAPGANHNGVQIELAGYARQSRAEWEDTFSTAMLRQAAGLVAQLSDAHGVPVRFRSALDLRRGGSEMRGITTHNEVSKAFRKTDHYDPGPNFPMDKFISWVNEAKGGSAAAAERKAMAEAFAQFPKAIDACLIPGHSTGDGRPGVWVLGSDGGVFTAPQGAPVPFFGSMGGKPLNAPMIKIVTFGASTGYYLVAEDGGIFAFGSAPALQPYKPLMAEYTRGERKVVGAEWIGTALVLLASDGAAYRFEVPR